MISTAKNRGQTIVVGSLLMLGLAVAFLVFLQISIFPDINQSRELDSQSNALDSMIDFRSSMQLVASSGTSQTVDYENQVNYPLQPAAPPEQKGQLSFMSGDLEINNAEEIERYNNGTKKPASEYNTFTVDKTGIASTAIYQPTYIEISDKNRKIVMDNTVIKENTPSNDVTHTNQSIISGNQINIVALETGQVDGIKSPDNIPISINPTDEIDKEITGNGGDITLTINSNRDQPDQTEPWASLVSNEPNVVDVRSSGDNLEIDLDGSKDYNLNLVYADIRF